MAAAALGLSLATTSTTTCFCRPSVPTRCSFPVGAAGGGGATALHQPLLNPEDATRRRGATGRMEAAASPVEWTADEGGDEAHDDLPRRRPPPTTTITTSPLAGMVVGRRGGLAAGAVWLSAAGAARAAILEADDDVELLERVKRDRKRRIERQGVISSSGKETVYLQELVYKLSKVGQAIDNNDLPAASSVLAPAGAKDWLQNVNTAFAKLSSSPEEKTEAEAFSSSLVSLISSVARNDVESSKVAFVDSASALEKWVALTGLVGQLKGL